MVACSVGKTQTTAGSNNHGRLSGMPLRAPVASSQPETRSRQRGGRADMLESQSSSQEHASVSTLSPSRRRNSKD